MPQFLVSIEAKKVQMEAKKEGEAGAAMKQKRRPERRQRQVINAANTNTPEDAELSPSYTETMAAGVRGSEQRSSAQAASSY
jgi:hypothetical protein